MNNKSDLNPPRLKVSLGTSQPSEGVGDGLEIAMNEWSKKLRDPKWQKMRLKILDRDGFRCLICEDDKSELHVHHTWYQGSLDPWEYPERTLLTLCASCHADEPERRKAARRAIADALSECGFLSGDLEDLLTFIDQFWIGSCKRAISRDVEWTLGKRFPYVFVQGLYAARESLKDG